MDTITHAILGGAASQAVLGKYLGRWAWLAGAAGAALPDIDILFGARDLVVSHAMHRHFTHSLLLVPALGVAAALPLLTRRHFRAHKHALAAGTLLGSASHGLLDACTSYGTHLLWPFSDARVSWDLIAIIDPVFTAILLAGLITAALRRRPRAAHIALGLCAVYLGLAAVQHGRAMSVQRQLAELRGQHIERGRVMPTLGNIVAWRSVYEAGGMLHVDGIRLSPFRGARIRAGGSLPAANVAELHSSLSPSAQRDLEVFAHFADGYLARVPGHEDVLGDMRYSPRSDSFMPLWGLRIGTVSNRRAVEWVNMERGRGRGIWRVMWDDILGRGGGYRTLQSMRELLVPG